MNSIVARDRLSLSFHESLTSCEILFRWKPKVRKVLCFDVALFGTAPALVLASIYLCAFSRSVAAQEVEGQRLGPTEEVVITAPRRLRSMRAAIEEAEDLAFSAFNELNTDDDYDIVCHRETPTGSRVSYRNCRARFVDRLLSESTDISFSLGVPQPLPLSEIRLHMEELAEKIESLASQNPDFREATIELQLRKDEYAAAIEANREE